MNMGRFLSRVVLAASLLGMASTPASAQLQYEHALRVEGAAALMVSTPHSSLFGLGGGGGIGYELRLHDYIGVEAHFSVFAFPSDDARVDTGTYFGPSLGLRLHLLPQVEAVDLYVVGRAALPITGGEVRFGIEADLGVEIPLGDQFAVGPFLRYVHIFQPDDNQLGEPNGQFLAFGLTARLTFGMPEAEPQDTDGDGFMDAEDDCPNEPEDDDGFEDRDGCPDPDNDRDGVLDEVDECPLMAEDMDGDRDEDGCPEDVADADGDGVGDAVDHCINEPEDRDSFQDEDGCPELDNDEDGVPDTSDECPLVPGPAESNGCPAVAQISSSIQILQKIEFRTDRSYLLRRSIPILRDVATFLDENPQLTRVRVEGHTDNRAGAEWNMTLSRLRAEAVRDWLVENGIDSARLEPVGFGETRPRSGDDSEGAHQANRRVEFVILSVE